MEPAGIERKTCHSLDNLTIVYSVCGAGEPGLVFVHGGMADRTFWNSQLEAFAKSSRTIALDLAGHGESGWNRAKWGIPEFGADVRAVVEAEDLGRVVILGNSLGGPVAIEAALLMPDRTVGVVGVDTFQDLGRRIEPEEARHQADAFGADYPGTLKVMLRRLFHPDVDPDFMADIERRMARPSPEVVRLMFLGLGGYDSGASARKLNIPIRAVNGDLYPTDIEKIRTIKPDFDAVVMTHTGHYPMLEKPKEFNRLLAGVLVDLVRK